MANVFRGKFKKPHDRVLRTYERVARDEHTCNFCPNSIRPGGRYTAAVIVRETRDYGGPNKLRVEKCHDECPEDPHRYRIEEDEEEHRREESKKESPEEAKEEPEVLIA